MSSQKPIPAQLEGFSEHERGGSIPVAVSTTLLKVVEAMPPDSPEQREVFSMLDGALQACLSLYEAKAPMREKVIAIHNEVDNVIRDDLNKQAGLSPSIKCGSGCGGCCHIPVSISFVEAELLVEQAKKLNITLDEAKLYRQTQAVSDAAKWREMSDADRRCVFLGDDNNCRVYKHRPASCRKYFSVTDPEYCNDKKYPGHDVGVWYSMRAEIIESAAMSVFGVGNMAEQLTKAMRAS